MSHNGTYCGYLIHISRTVTEVLRRSPAYRLRVQSDGFADWDTSIFTFAAETFQRECGLWSLKVRSAWIGNGCKGFCWILPPEMRKKNCSSEDNKGLEVFKRLMGIQGEPVTFYPVNGPEPWYLRNIGAFTKEVEDMLYETCYERFNSGEMSVESLDQDMAKLTVKAH